jgi:hypothetical protein
MFCVYTLRQHPLYTLASLVAYTLLQPLRIPKGARPIKHKMLGIEPRLAFIYGVLLANRVLIFRFQLLAVYVLLVHNCGECRIEEQILY